MKALLGKARPYRSARSCGEATAGALTPESRKSVIHPGTSRVLPPGLRGELFENPAGFEAAAFECWS
jgi:hypothetical protein